MKVYEMSKPTWNPDRKVKLELTANEILALSSALMDIGARPRCLSEAITHCFGYVPDGFEPDAELAIELGKLCLEMGMQ